MKNRTKFLIFHSLMIVFYVYMYFTSITYLDNQWGWISHRQFGFVMSLLIIGTFILFGKTLIPKFKHYFSLKKGNFKFKLFKISVILMIAHFVMSVATGIMMRYGINMYQYHKLSKFIVPALIIFHILTRLWTKTKKRSR